jgi:hypothetical protein
MKSMPVTADMEIINKKGLIDRISHSTWLKLSIGREDRKASPRDLKLKRSVSTPVILQRMKRVRVIIREERKEDKW